MFKRLCYGLIAVGMSALLVGCSGSTSKDSNDSSTDLTDPGNSLIENFSEVHGGYFEAEVLERGNAYVVIRDKNTGVVYLAVRGYKTAGITPVYNETGNVMCIQDDSE